MNEAAAIVGQNGKQETAGRGAGSPVRAVDWQRTGVLLFLTAQLQPKQGFRVTQNWQQQQQRLHLMMMGKCETN